MAKKKQPQRKVIVSVCLFTVLTGTTALLLALSPAPLTPDSGTVLFNVDGRSELESIFQTDRPLKSGHWSSILIHSESASITPANRRGNHFVICNGETGVDGEIQVSARWSAQTAALPPGDTQRIDPGCITIAVVSGPGGKKPTPMQMHRLDQLVKALQAKLPIPSEQVYTLQTQPAPLPRR